MDEVVGSMAFTDFGTIARSCKKFETLGDITTNFNRLPISLKGLGVVSHETNVPSGSLV
jgi:hypothetical protein